MQVMPRMKRLTPLAILAILFMAIYLLLSPTTPSVILRYIQDRELNIRLPLLPDVDNLEECAALNELRNVNFADSRLQHRLCEDSTAYKLVDGRYPLCQLNRNLPTQFYRIVRQGSRLASMRRVTGAGFIPIYTFDNDDLISKVLLNQQAWEPAQIWTMLKLLKKFDPGSVTFLDIGSSLGAYSLQVRAEGIPVVAVDANIRALIRLQLSAKELGVLDNKLKLFWCFINDKVALKRISWSADNISCNAGSASIGLSGWRQQVSKIIHDTIPVMTVRADELREHIHTKKVIVKMDIESGEYVFMKTGRTLFEQFDILALQMEFWRGSGEPPHSSLYYKSVTSFMTARNYSLSLISAIDYRVQDLSTFTEWDGIWVKNDFLHEAVALNRGEMDNINVAKPADSL